LSDYVEVFTKEITPSQTALYSAIDAAPNVCHTEINLLIIANRTLCLKAKNNRETATIL